MTIITVGENGELIVKKLSVEEMLAMAGIEPPNAGNPG